MRMRLGNDDPRDVTIASVSSKMEKSDSYIVVCLCPKCGEFIDEDIATCPKCNAVLIENEKAGKNASSDVLETKDSIFLCEHTIWWTQLGILYSFQVCIENIGHGWIGYD